MYQSVGYQIKPNEFLLQQQTEYVKSSKTRGQLKDVKKTSVLGDQTNTLVSAMNTVLPQKLKLEGYEEEVQDQGIADKQNASLRVKEGISGLKMKKKMIFEVEDSEEDSENKVKERNNADKVLKPCGEPNQVEINTGHRQQAPILKRDKNRNVFNLQLSDQSENSEEQQASASKLPAPQSETQKRTVLASEDQLPQIFTFQPSKCTHLELGDSSDDSKQQTIVQTKDQQKQIKNTTTVKLPATGQKKFIFDDDELNSDEDDEREDPVVNQQEEQELEQSLSVTKRINISKFRTINNCSNSILYSRVPIPEDHKISFVIKRNSDKSEYLVYDGDSVSQIMKVSKKMGGTYQFFESGGKGEKTEIGKMKVNFIGTEFDCYYSETLADAKVKRRFLGIKYEVNFLGLNGPRRVSLLAPEPNVPIKTETPLLQIFQKAKEKCDSGLKKYESKAPKWVSELNAYVLNMRGTAIESSIKNCIITDSDNPNKQFLIFGKKSKDVFNLDIKHPFTILQGVAFAVSSFEKKLGCE